MATLEREILAEARLVLNNPKLRMNDIMEWTTGCVKPYDGEVSFVLPDHNGITVCVKTACDKRKAVEG